MPPAIIAAAVAVGASMAASAGIIAVTTAMVITIAATTAAALLTKTSVPSIGSYTSQQERKQVLRSSTAPHVYIYGKTVVSGLLFFAEEEAGDEVEEWVHLAIAICAHEIDGIEKVWLGDDEIATYGEFAQYEIHNNRTTADPYMLSHCPSWKNDMIGKGICWARVSLKFDADKFPSGIPNIKFLVRGKKVYDPRIDNTVWSQNAALIIRDFYSSYLGVVPEDINEDQFLQGANLSDETVSDGGSPRPRYTINGSFDASETQAGILDDMHLACAGEPTYMAGQHGLLVGAYYGPATLTINPGQIISDVKIVPEAAYAQKLNTVTGTFLDPENQYAESDYPAVQIEEYVLEDEDEYTDDAKYRFVANEYQAQQLATLKINRTRIGRSITFTMNMSGYMYRPGYYVFLNIPQLGINNQEFRITEWSLSAETGVDITLKQETAEVWGDAIGQAIDRPDLTDLPKASIAPPINLAYDIEEIGEVVQGVLSWNNASSNVRYNIVVIRKDGVVVQTIQVPGERVNITGLVRGSYQMGVMSVNIFGVRSSEAMILVEIHAPDAPNGCVIDQGYFAITLKPTMAQVTNVSTQFDFWTSGETRLANSSTATVEQNADRKGQGKTWLSSDLQVGHTYWWYIRTFNAFGTSGFLEVQALCDTDISEIGDMISEEIEKSDAFQSLQEPTRVSLEGMLTNAVANNANVKTQFAQLGPIKAQVLTVTTTVANQEMALASLEFLTQSNYNELQSTTYQLQQSLTTVDRAVSTLQQQTTAQFQQVNAVVDTKLTSNVTSDGTASATFSLNLGITRYSTYYGGGMAMSIEPSGGSYKVTTVFKTDQFGIYSSVAGSYTLAFAVVNGQVYLADALIRDASIVNAKIANGAINRAKITDSLQSDNYVANSTGMILNFANGNIAINGNVSGQGRMSIANNRIDVYDGSGVLRVRIGQL